MSVFDAIRVVSGAGIRRLPIVDDNGALRGVVTLDDVLVLLGSVVSEVADTISSHSRRGCRDDPVPLPSEIAAVPLVDQMDVATVTTLQPVESVCRDGGAPTLRTEVTVR